MKMIIRHCNSIGDTLNEFETTEEFLLWLNTNSEYLECLLCDGDTIKVIG
jgi:hypothetical protein